MHIRLYEPIPGEVECIEVRRFPLFLLFVFWRFFLRAVVPLFIGSLLVFILNDFSFQIPFIQILFGIYLLYISVLFIFIFVEWFNEELDVLIVTNKRIIIFTQQTFFKRQSSIASLDQIQDVKGSMQGFIQNMLNIGVLEIQTAAEKARFRMDEIPHPEQVAGIINQELQKMKEGKDFKNQLLEQEPIMNNNFLDQLVVTRGKLKQVL